VTVSVKLLLIASLAVLAHCADHKPHLFTSVAAMLRGSFCGDFAMQLACVLCEHGQTQRELGKRIFIAEALLILNAALPCTIGDETH
jgi:hypothetical protein